MTILRAAAVNAAVLLGSISNGYAGPCSSRIEQTQQSIDAKLQAREADGASARESTSATSHRQTTPHSIARAEETLRGLSAEKVSRGGSRGSGGLLHDTVTQFMGLIVLAMGVQFALTGFPDFLLAQR